MSRRPLTCCICGEYAGKFEQHWNRDAGWGVCPQCVSEQAAIVSPEELAELYGAAGVNYDVPMVRHYGLRFRVLAATKSRDVANAFMLRTPNAAVLKIFEDTGLIVMADVADVGEPVPA